ncbi:hypothetical protein EDD21DRAFT_182806 [Dissophora ornata]|nr:hypothetical protein BGZ58_002385 [Dissophora ornata]KAI8604911.1 hypothetical protein EDD21DRAFT_182806 [Dissophora ornata]
MPRRAKDPIAEYSVRLCEYMNGHPTIVLSYARYFGEYPEASKATMTAVDQDGFDVTCLDHGQEQELRVTFRHSMHAVSQVKDALMAMAKEAKTGLRGDDPNNPGLMPDSPSVIWPYNHPVTWISICVVLTAYYLEFFPNTTSPILQWILQSLGASTIHYIYISVTLLHFVESMVSLYFTAVVGRDFFGPIDIVQWFMLIFVCGYPGLLELIPLANRQRKQKEE